MGGKNLYMSFSLAPVPHEIDKTCFDATADPYTSC